MLPRSFLPIAAFITAAIATPTLLLEVSGPSTVNSIDRLNITTTVRNVGDEAVKLLNHPRSPLSDLPTDMFTITNRYGFSPDFIGIGVKYSPSVAAASNDHHAYTVLMPGQFVSVEHDISDAYDFSTSGPGQYIVRMKSTRMFYYVVDGKVATLAGGRSEPFHTVTIVGDARSHESPSHRPSDEQCEAWETHAINAAIPLAKKYVRRAVEVLKKGDPQDGHYMRWFGRGLYGNRHSVVSGHFEALVDNDFAGYAYTCHAHFCANRPGVFGYAYTNKFGAIHLCNQVFEAEIGGQDSRASTIVHQALLFAKNAGGVVEHIHGEALALELTESYPHLAATNADNYEYFAVAAAGDGGDDGSVLLTEVYFGKHISGL